MPFNEWFRWKSAKQSKADFMRNALGISERGWFPPVSGPSPLVREWSPLVREWSPLVRERFPPLRERSPPTRRPSPPVPGTSPLPRERSPPLRRRLRETPKREAKGKRPTGEETPRVIGEDRPGAKN